MRLRSLAWNAAENRPRAPVRLLLALLVVVALLAGWAFVVAPRLGAGVSFPLRVLAALVAIALPGVGVLAAVVAIDRRTLADVGLGVDADWAVDLVFGLILGAALMTGIFVVALAAGWIRIAGLFVAGSVPGGFAGGFAALVALFLVVGVSEELVARGYLLTNAAEGLAGYGSRREAVVAAVVVSSLAFGLAHLRNPNATLVSAMGVTLVGAFVAVGYVLTGELAIPVGVHVSWNLFQGGVYGFAVSGLGIGVSVVDAVETGPDLLTGGAFGPEAGLLGLAAALVGVACTVWYVRWRYGEARVAPGLTRPDLR